MNKVKWFVNKAKQFVKFSIVGISNTIINLSVYYFLLYLGVHYNIAYALGFLISVCNAFYWNNKYVFKNKRETSTIKAFLKVFASYGFTFILSILIMSGLIELLGISRYIAPLLKLVIIIPINFVLNKIWAFKDSGRKK